jgi:excinuclease ABC subunit A
VINARENNLRNVTVGFPVGLMTCVTGVSGSGKSTLVNDVLCRALFRHFYHAKEAPGAHDGIDGLDLIDKAIVIDQTPIGRTPRSNPLTYTGAFNSIRDLFAQLPSSRVRGYGPGRFSFNVKGGRCEHCEGDGVIKIEMNFLPPVYVTCEACGGRRFNRETLEITYKGLNIADVLEMTVDDGLNFFPQRARRRRQARGARRGRARLLHLGQQATTLSGGEAQRVKLAAELAKRPRAARCTSSTNRPAASTSPTSSSCSRSSSSCATRATRSSSSSTSSTSSNAPTTSSTSAPKAATAAGRSWPRARPNLSPRNRRAIRGGFCGRCLEK